MKNSTLIKGSAAIALGAALLLGGGGTLANWNAEATTTPGTIVAGDLNVQDRSGVWTDRAGDTIDITTYKVVPGDKLTYTQDLTVTLKGNKMAANVATTGITADQRLRRRQRGSLTGPALTVRSHHCRQPARGCRQAARRSPRRSPSNSCPPPPAATT